MPKTNEMSFKIQGFQYSRSLDLNMVYYHIRLSENSSSLCTNLLPWGRYRYKCQPMGVTNSPYIFQQKMNDLFHGFEFICVYIGEILVSTKG